MQMSDIENFLRLSGVVSQPGATEDAIAAFERRTSLTLLPELRRFYLFSDGLAIDCRGECRVNSLAEAEAYYNGFQQWGIPAQWGYFAFTDRNDSNPHCICCDGPAKGYVVRVNHDDAANIEYRSLDSFFAAVRRVIAPTQHAPGDEEPSLWNLPQDFSSGARERTAADVTTAHRLLACAKTLEEGSVERADAERWAITLFSDNEIDEIAGLLDSGDEYRREEAIGKLSQMASPQAQEVVQRYRREVNQFSRKAVDALKQAGLTVAEVRNGQPRLEPGGVWLNMPMFFTKRRRPTIFADIVQRASELIALKTKGKS